MYKKSTDLTNQIYIVRFAEIMNLDPNTVYMRTHFGGYIHTKYCYTGEAYAMSTLTKGHFTVVHYGYPIAYRFGIGHYKIKDDLVDLKMNMNAHPLIINEALLEERIGVPEYPMFMDSLAIIIDGNPRDFISYGSLNKIDVSPTIEKMLICFTYSFKCNSEKMQSFINKFEVLLINIAKQKDVGFNDIRFQFI